MPEPATSLSEGPGRKIVVTDEAKSRAVRAVYEMAGSKWLELHPFDDPDRRALARAERRVDVVIEAMRGTIDV